MRFSFLVAEAMIGLIGVSAAATAPRMPVVPPPAHIILIRHAEKPSDPNDPHLSAAGRERAQRLASYMVNDPAMIRFGVPVAIFANRPTKDGDGQRSQETVQPLADRLQLPVQLPFPGKDYAVLARQILADRAYAGKTVLICWNHSALSPLAAALGVTPQPPQWKDRVFDRGYLISYPQGKAALTTFHYDRDHGSKE